MYTLYLHEKCLKYLQKKYCLHDTVRCTHVPRCQIAKLLRLSCHNTEAGPFGEGRQLAYRTV